MTNKNNKILSFVIVQAVAYTVITTSDTIQGCHSLYGKNVLTKAIIFSIDFVKKRVLN